MKREMSRLEIITENLANNTTPGFRRAYPVGESFDKLLQQAGRNNDAAAVDFSTGALRETGNPFDFAINGEGFFTVGKENREFYTRNGHFTLGPDGSLMTDSGLNVLDANSRPMKIPNDLNTANLSIDSKGNLKVGENIVGQLKLVAFQDPKALNRVGTALFEKPADTKMEPAKIDDFKVMNRSLEGSNTVVFEEMANMITCMRNYETCSKILKAQDGKDGQIIQQLS